MRSKEQKAAAPVAPLERKLPEGFKLPLPKLLVPEHIEAHVCYPDVLYRTSGHYTCGKCEDLANHINNTFREALLIFNAEPCKVNVPNGTYKLCTDGALHDQHDNMDRCDNESLCTISGGFTYKLNKLISDTHDTISNDHELLLETYESNGGDKYYIDVPENHTQIRYYWCIVDEGLLYITDYKPDI